MILVDLSGGGTGAVRGQYSVADTLVLTVVDDKPAVGVIRGSVMSLVARIGVNLGATVPLRPPAVWFSNASQ